MQSFAGAGVAVLSSSQYALHKGTMEIGSYGMALAVGVDV